MARMLVAPPSWNPGMLRLASISCVLLTSMLVLHVGAGPHARAKESITPGDVVEGIVTISSDGLPIDVIFDSGLPTSSIDSLRQQVLGWRFDPIEIPASRTSTAVRLRSTLVNMQGGDGRVSVRLVNGRLGARARFATRGRPAYPDDAAHIGISGAVSVAVLFDAKGRVEATHLRQISLNGRISDPKFDGRFRKQFANVALKFASRSMVEPIDVFDDPFARYAAIMPFTFTVDRTDGRTLSLIPGPVSDPEWLQQTAIEPYEVGVAQPIATDKPGEIFLIDTRFRHRRHSAEASLAPQ